MYISKIVLWFQHVAGGKKFDRCLLQVSIQFPVHRGGFFGRNLGEIPPEEEIVWKGSGRKSPPEGKGNFWKGWGILLYTLVFFAFCFYFSKILNWSWPILFCLFSSNFSETTQTSNFSKLFSEKKPETYKMKLVNFNLTFSKNRSKIQKIYCINVKNEKIDIY